MRHPEPERVRRVGVVLALAALLLTGCTGDDAPVVPSRTPAPTPSAAAGPTFDQAVAALTPALVPTAEVRRCEEYEPGSPQAQEYLDRVAAEASAASTGEESVAAPTPTLPSCAAAGVTALRAESLTGFAHGPQDPVVLPVAGGAARIVTVHELPDAETAAATYAARIADDEGWAQDQEIPAEELDGGNYTPRRVVTGARLEGVDLPGWTATVLSRDEASFTRDGAPASAPVSYSHLWAVGGTLVVRVQVAADEPGSAATTAGEVARAFVEALEDVSADG